MSLVILKKYIVAGVVGVAVSLGSATESHATRMIFTGIISQVNVTSNLGNFAVGDPPFGSVAIVQPGASYVNVGSVKLSDAGENFQTQIQNDPKKGFVLYHLQFFTEQASPYASADGGFDLVGYFPTGIRPPIG